VAPRILKSVTSRRFWQEFGSLPGEVQDLARKTYKLWLQDPRHPSLHFKLLAGSKNRFSVRIGLHCLAIGRIEGTTVTWVWIGSHAEYDRLTQNK